MPTLTRQQFEQMAKENMPPGMSKKGYLRSLVLNGYTLQDAQVGHDVAMDVARRADEPGFLENTVRGLYKATQAPGNLMAGVIEDRIAKVARFFGAENVATAIEGGSDVQGIGTAMRETLQYAPTYGTVIGSAVGAPGLGAAAGQAIQEFGTTALGENTDTAFQQIGDIALAGIGGRIAGANPTSILGTAGRSALGEAVVQGGRNLLGNQQLSLKQQAQAIGTSGLFGGGAVATARVAGAAIGGALQGGADDGIRGALRGAGSSGSKAAKAVMDELDAPFKKVLGLKLSNPNAASPVLDADIDTVVQKALRPRSGSRGETKFTQKRYDENARYAFKDIAANKDKIKLIDADGIERPSGSVPQSLADLSEANDQMLKQIASRTNAMHEFATGQGLKISTDGVVKELRGFAANSVIRDRFPRLADQADALAARYEARGTYSPDDVQSIVAQANQEVRAFERNPNPNDIGLSVLSSLEKNAWDKSLSSTIDGLTDDGIFKELKRSYAAQKTIQGDVNFRLNVFQRQNPAGLIDHFAINTAADAAKALATFDPVYIASAAGQSAWRNWIKFKNSPDTMIRGLFKKLEGIDRPSILQQADEAMERARILRPDGDMQMLTPEERATGLIGGGGDNMPRTTGSADLSSQASKMKAEGKSFEEFVSYQQPKRVSFTSAKQSKGYMGGHEAPMAEDINNPIWDLTGDYTGNQLYPKDIYRSDASRMYFSGMDYDTQAMSILHSVKDKPNARVTIYRSVPKDAKAEINPGDWVTITREYAKDHGESNLGGKYKIVSKEVFARDIFTDANSIQEFGYDPQPKILASDMPNGLLESTYKRYLQSVNNGKAVNTDAKKVITRYEQLRSIWDKAGVADDLVSKLSDQRGIQSAP